MSGHTTTSPSAGRASTSARALAALLSGTVFGLGLGVAQMIDPLKVLGFLDLAGAWDPSLLFVLGAAVAVAAAGFALLRRRPGPVLGGTFHPPSSTAIDARLVAGSVLFGAGWGLGGYCPGPAIASLGFANPEALWFVPALLLGTGLGRWQLRRQDRAAAAAGRA